MNLKSASSRSRLSHWNAPFRFSASAISSGFWFWNSRAYAWLLATPRLKKTSWAPSVNSGSVCTPMRIGGALRSRFLVSLERVEEVLVVAVGLGREVVPHETLHRLIERGRRRQLVRVRNDALEDFHPVDEVALVLRRVVSLDREAEQARRVGVAEVDGEGDGIDTRHGVRAIAPDFPRFEAHGREPPRRVSEHYITNCHCVPGGLRTVSRGSRGRECAAPPQPPLARCDAGQYEQSADGLVPRQALAQ